MLTFDQFTAEETLSELKVKVGRSRGIPRIKLKVPKGFSAKPKTPRISGLMKLTVNRLAGTRMKKSPVTGKPIIQKPTPMFPAIKQRSFKPSIPKAPKNPLLQPPKPKKPKGMGLPFMPLLPQKPKQQSPLMQLLNPKPNKPKKPIIPTTI